MTKKIKNESSHAYTMQDKKDIGFAKKKKRHIIKNTFYTVCVLFLALIVFTFSYVMGLDEWKNFDPSTMKNMQQSIVLYDMDNQEIGSLFASKNRRYITLDEIPKDVIDAFIATEDARFYTHNGVDVVRIIGAILEDIKSLSYKQGASTISQQLIKNAYLTSEKSISRKFQEAIMAVKLENYYTKDQILEIYINYIYYGGGAYGIESASKRYFGKQAKHLTLCECALLAGVVKAPSNYAPHIDETKSIQRRNLVLSLMFDQGFITETEYNNAKDTKIALATNESSDFDFGYFTDLALRETSEVLNLDIEEVLGSGYKIYTTLDSDLQSYTQALYTNNEYFPQNAADGTPCQSAIIVMDSKSSAIRTCVGGRQYTSKLCFNRATDMLRQPGSTIKPIMVYAPAVEKQGYLPSSFVLDEIENFNGYIPKNFNNRTMGWVTLRQAVSKSLNIPAVRLLDEIGIEESKIFASNFGIFFEPEDVSLSLALGGFSKGVAPSTICSAYTSFANGGYYSREYCIESIVKPDGTVIYQKKSDGYNVISEQSAFLVSSMLRSSVESGTSKALNMEDIPLSAKTGTTEFEGDKGNRDAWIVAYNSDYTACCWMGFDKTSQDMCLSNKITGGSLPANLTKQVFSEIYKNKKAPEFIKPKDIVTVKLDTKALFEQKTPLLASTFTPSDQITEEFFTSDTMPTKYTNYWDIPQTPSDLAVSKSVNGYPIISFTPLDEDVYYKLIRKSLIDNAEIEIANFEKTQNLIQYIDTSVEDQTSYLYCILPIHKQIKNGDEPLYGNYSSSVLFEFDNIQETVNLEPAV